MHVVEHVSRESLSGIGSVKTKNIQFQTEKNPINWHTCFYKFKVISNVNITWIVEPNIIRTVTYRSRMQKKKKNLVFFTTPPQL